MTNMTPDSSNLSQYVAVIGHKKTQPHEPALHKPPMHFLQSIGIRSSTLALVISSPSVAANLIATPHQKLKKPNDTSSDQSHLTLPIHPGGASTKPPCNLFGYFPDFTKAQTNTTIRIHHCPLVTGIVGLRRHPLPRIETIYSYLLHDILSMRVFWASGTIGS